MGFKFVHLGPQTQLNGPATVSVLFSTPAPIQHNAKNLLYLSMRVLHLTILLLLAAAALPAQTTEQKPLKLGVGLLGASYVGDLNTNGQALHRFYPGLSVSLQFDSQKLVAPQLNTGFGKFVAQDRELAGAEGVQPNTYVETPFFFVDFRLRARFLRETAFNPYFSLGIGLLGYTPKDQDGNNLLDNFSTRAESETYGSITAGFPFSLGFEVQLSPLVGLGLEYTYRLTTSDYLDNISQFGLREGKDRIQSLLMSVYFTFDPNRSLNNGIRGKDRR